MRNRKRDREREKEKEREEKGDMGWGEASRQKQGEVGDRELLLPSNSLSPLAALRLLEEPYFLASPAALPLSSKARAAVSAASVKALEHA